MSNSYTTRANMSLCPGELLRYTSVRARYVAPVESRYCPAMLFYVYTTVSRAVYLTARQNNW